MASGRTRTYGISLIFLSFNAVGENCPQAGEALASSLWKERERLLTQESILEENVKESIAPRWYDRLLLDRASIGATYGNSLVWSPTSNREPLDFSDGEKKWYFQFNYTIPFNAFRKHSPDPQMSQQLHTHKTEQGVQADFMDLTHDLRILLTEKRIHLKNGESDKALLASLKAEKLTSRIRIMTGNQTFTAECLL